MLLLFLFWAYILGVSAKSRLTLTWYKRIKRESHTFTALCLINWIFIYLFIYFSFRLLPWKLDLVPQCCVTFLQTRRVQHAGIMCYEIPTHPHHQFFEETVLLSDYSISLLFIPCFSISPLSSKSLSPSSLDYNLHGTVSIL